MNAINFTSLSGLLIGAACVCIDCSEVHAGNPVVWSTSSVGSSYDPFQDHWHIDRQRVSARESFYDFNRQCVDPGSYRYVDRYFWSQGRLIHEFGPTWTSHGKPHGQLTREYVQHIPSGYGPGGGYVPGSGYPGGYNPGGPFLGGGYNPGGWSGSSGTIHDSDTVLYMQRPPQTGGSTHRNRDIVLYNRAK